MRFIENWVIKNWDSVKRIFLDTIIPKYNGGFYERMGYKNIGSSSCNFFNKYIEAIRYEKFI